ncbi:MAG: adenosylcobalamin-dependent ribonucleoside-diphosphate reductase [Anaerolineae bacterium]
MSQESQLTIASSEERAVKLTENARVVLMKRYVRRGPDGKPVETPEGMFRRVARAVAEPDREAGADAAAVEATERAFYHLLTELRFFPNSPTFTGAGTPLGQLAACFVLPISDDMGRDSAGIFQTLRDAALIQQTGGGNGFSFGRLRPKGAYVASSAGQATGPVGFLRVYDKAFGEIAQGGTRRGANMAVLPVHHPDVMDFVNCKVSEDQITNFNISVGITDKFMEAVRADKDFELLTPHDGSVAKTMRAREIFDAIVKNAYRNGEPGVLFLDAANRQNPVPHLYALEATNPCGEQWLGPYENCCLGSINLAQHMKYVGDKAEVDWKKLQESTVLSTHFLDNVVTANKYVPAVPQLKEAAHRARRIGLGIMGLGDLMYHLGIRYGSEEAQEFAAQVMEFVRYHCMKTSVQLAKDRGAFPAIEGSLYDPKNLKWTPPQPLAPYQHDWGRPAIKWEDIVKGIKQYGIRNAAQTTVAPTGTIATVAGCEAYGCEPVFALAYMRHVVDAEASGKDGRTTLTYASPLFEQALIRSGVEETARKRIYEEVMEHGSCQNLKDVPDSVRHAFVVSADITPDEHVRMQAAIQAFVDNSISKTCNFPENAVEADVAKAYFTAWELGCKGLTVYVTGSRDKVVLETKATAKKKEEKKDEKPAEIPMPITKKPRPRRLRGETFRIGTPLGTAFITININGGDQPFEVFLNVGKAGSDTAAVAEAMGRIISLVLRLPSPMNQTERLKLVTEQLAGIGGGRSLGFGPNRVRSLPDGVAQALAEFLSGFEPASNGNGENHGNGNGSTSHSHITVETHAQPDHALKIGDLCPECGEATYVNEEGCRKCYSCGHSEC